jgi:hypothetical protein
MFTKSSTLNISLTKNPQPNQLDQQQQLFNIMQANVMAQQHQSPTHFFASLLQNPTVLSNPELMASVASMLQNSLSQTQVNINQQVAQLAQAPIIPVNPVNMNINQYPSNGNCFRNFSIPNSDSTKQTDNNTNSSLCDTDSHIDSSSTSRGLRSPSQHSDHSVNSSSLNGSIAESSKSRDSQISNISNNSSNNNIHHVDVSKYANSNELVINKVMTVIEEILNNDNIKKNNFLIKLFEENTTNLMRPQILIKRVAGFKRVKAISTDFKIIQSAMDKSIMFNLSNDGLSAFRVMPLPNINSGNDSGISSMCTSPVKIPFKDSAFNVRNMSNTSSSNEVNINKKLIRQTTNSNSKDQDNKVVKQILAINFAEDDFSIEKMTSSFEKIGEIAQIILVRPGKKIPEFLQDYTQWVSDLGTKPCAVIDFETQEAAQNACREINMSNKGGHGIRCALLKPGARIKRTLYRKYTTGQKQEQQEDQQHQENQKITKIDRSISLTSTSTSSSRPNSQDSGINHNSSLSFQKQFNRKNVKKAISKHFISLGAWKNSTNGEADSDNVMNGQKDFCSFLRQPKGPAINGNGFGMARNMVH